MKFNNKIVVKSLSILFILCISFIGCNDDDVEKLELSSISFGKDSISVLDDVVVEYLQLELTEPLESNCFVYLKSSVEESERFTFPNRIFLGKGVVRGKYPIYVNESKYSSLDEYVTFTLYTVDAAVVIDVAKSSVEFTIKGKLNTGKVSIGFQHKEYFVGEDQIHFDLPFEIQGVLEDTVKLIVNWHQWTPVAGETAVAASEGIDFSIKKEIQISRGENWNFIPLEIIDNQTSSNDRKFIVSLDEVVTSDTLITISPIKRECIVTIRNFERRLQVTDSIVDVPEYIDVFKYDFNLTAAVKEIVTAKVVVDITRSTAEEFVHFELLQKEIELSPGDTRAEVEIKIFDDKLGNEDRKIFLKLEGVQGVTVSETRSVGEIVIQNDDTSIGFSKDLQAIYSESTKRIPITIEGLRDEKLLIDFAVINGTAEEGTDFLILTLKPIIEKDQKTAYIEISSSAIDGNKDFQLKLIGLKGEDLITKSIIDPSRALCVVQLERKIDKGTWKIINKVTNSGKNYAKNIIDGLDATYWENHWQKKGPWNIVIDMAEKRTIRQLRLAGRYLNNNDATFVEAYISNEPLDEKSTEWKKIVVWDNKDGKKEDGNITRNVFDIDGAPSARYLMIKVVKGRDQKNSTGGFSEITVNPE